MITSKHELPSELARALTRAKAPIAETTAHFVDRLGTGITTGDELRSTELDLERDRVAVLLEVAGASLEVLKHTLIEKAELAIRNAALQNVMVQAQAVALNAAPRPKSQCKRRQPATNVLLRNAALRELKAKVRDLKSKGYTAPQICEVMCDQEPTPYSIWRQYGGRCYEWGKDGWKFNRLDGPAIRTWVSRA
jgi:hypothetical protein